MTERIKTLANKKTALNKDITLNNDSNSNDQLKIKFTISYIDPLSEKFRNVIKDTVSVISFYSMNKLSNVIRAQKHLLLASCKKNVVKFLVKVVMQLTSDKQGDKLKQKSLNVDLIIET